jgi:aminoglycoside/choline kinase family phosphotransferase
LLTPERDAEIRDFLSRHGWAQATRIAFPGDASTRRYERLIGVGRSAILMDAPRANETGPCPPGATPEQRAQLGWSAVSRLAASRVEAFAAVAGHLRGLGLSAPEILAVDTPAGLAVVEDLGDDLFARIIPQSAAEDELYAEAARLLAAVHDAPIPEVLRAPDGETWPILDFDAVALRANVDLYVDWAPRFSPAMHVSEAARAQWTVLTDALIARAQASPAAFTIRDYHAENLVWLPRRSGLRRIGLLDFQDAVRGFRMWDFSMLLDDARRDVSPAARAAALNTYAAQVGGRVRELDEELSVLSVLNVVRILGIFARLVTRDAKPRYAAFMPRMRAHLARALGDPELADLRRWFVAHAPQELGE